MAEYLAGVLNVYVAFCVETFTSLAASPGGFLGKEVVEARAADRVRILPGPRRKSVIIPHRKETFTIISSWGTL